MCFLFSHFFEKALSHLIFQKRSLKPKVVEVGCGETRIPCDSRVLGHCAELPLGGDFGFSVYYKDELLDIKWNNSIDM